MAVLEQYNYLFVITTLFAFLDAWNIGANDVANSFATSVSSRSLTMKQAMAIAAVAEFSGSVAVGSRVAETIRTKIVDPKLYASRPSVLFLAMMCAIIGSSTFLTVATRFGLPVSTTHSIVGGLVGAATASVGIRNISWGWSGVSQVFAAWIVAPGIAAVIGALLFLITRKLILERRAAVRNALVSIPIYTFITVGALTMLIAWKGVQLNRPDLDPEEIIIAIFSVAGGITVLQVFFVLPFIWQRIIKEDWALRWWMVWQGPWVLRRPRPGPPPPGTRQVNIKNYYRGHLTAEELAHVKASESIMTAVRRAQSSADLENDHDDFVMLTAPSVGTAPSQGRPSLDYTDRRMSSEMIPPRPPGPWYNLHVLLWRFNRVLLRGLEQDVISLQKRNAVLSWNLEDMHARASHFDNRAEYMYSALQILTAASASFVHGANDVANSIGPFTSAYQIWQTGAVEARNEVPLWILAFGGGAIVLGLLTYGYHVMRNLGNRLTLISPSRGFCMEMASAITVLMATRLSLPVSTTQCITGATVGVGLANGDWRCINPRLVAWIYMGWLITVPITAVISGSLMGLILNAPRWEGDRF